ncbi:parasite-infected erythrocyte surface protein (PIESP15), partial [Plasmodium ovale curtisi]
SSLFTIRPIILCMFLPHYNKTFVDSVILRDFLFLCDDAAAAGRIVNRPKRAVWFTPWWITGYREHLLENHLYDHSVIQTWELTTPRNNNPYERSCLPFFFVPRKCSVGGICARKPRALNNLYYASPPLLYLPPIDENRVRPPRLRQHSTMKKSYEKAALVLAVLVTFFFQICKSELNNNGGQYPLATHSFRSPIAIKEIENGWVLDYATACTDKYLVLIPSVYSRRGLLYHTKPIRSDSINIEFSFHIRKGYYKESIEESYYKPSEVKPITYKLNVEERNKVNGFAFWLLQNEIDVQSANINSVDVSLEENEINLYGYKKTFNGIGIFFQLKNNELIVSALANNGNKNWNLNDYITKNYNLRMIQYKDNVNIKIITQKGDIRLFIFSGKTGMYEHCLTIKKKIPKENYIGFSAFNFNEDEKIPLTSAGKYIPTFVGITGFLVHTSEVIAPEQYTNDNIYIKNDVSTNNFENISDDMLNNFSQNKDKESKSDDINALRKVMQNFISSHINNEQKILQHIDLLNENVGNIISELKTIKKIVMNRSEEPKHFHKVFTTELSGLKNLFHSHAQHHKKNIEDITNTLTRKIDDNHELKMLAEKAQTLEHIINKGNSTSYLFSLAFTALIVLTLILIYKKIRDVEKKHIL